MVRAAVVLDVRVVADSTGAEPNFLGRADPPAIRLYLDEATHTEPVDVEDEGLPVLGDLDGDPVLIEHTGSSAAAVPADEGFWTSSVEGSGRSAGVGHHPGPQPWCRCMPTGLRALPPPSCSP
jgi:hypothetical protein